MADDKDYKNLMLPEGKVINNSVFVKDQYKDPKTGKLATPSYKIEVGVDPASLLDPDENTPGVISQCFNWAVEEFGENIYFDIDKANYTAEEQTSMTEVRTPFLSGDKLKAKREKKGKNGDAYAGLTIIRMNTTFNKDGADAPGGVEVYNEAVEHVGIVEGNQNQIYNGCKAKVLGTFSAYGEVGDDDDLPGFKFYLKAVQKTGDGTPIRTPRSSASAFTPLKKAADGGASPAAAGPRRVRKG